MRGKLLGDMKKYVGNRITPADAGKTTVHPWAVGLTRDHPRGCGENSMSNPTSKRKKGSPPRMRGKLTFKFVIFKFVRITPADAGKTIIKAE